VIVDAIILGLLALAVIAVLLRSIGPVPHHGPYRMKSEITQLALALERCRIELGHGEYPPGSTDDPEAFRQFLVKAFPDYHGELPAKYKNLDAASSLVFWLGGMADKDGRMIGFSADPKNPFDTANKSRIGPFIDFDPARLRYDGGLLVYLPWKDNSQSNPLVYFRADSKGEYHGAWKKCRPCRDSVNGGWVNPESFQLFAPGKDGRCGSGVQYPSGTDYDAQRRDDLSNFARGALGNDIP
jgi:hypothetical protein